MKCVLSYTDTALLCLKLPVAFFKKDLGYNWTVHNSVVVETVKLGKFHSTFYCFREWVGCGYFLEKLYGQLVKDKVEITYIKT